jgi:hypothetical protein
VNATVLQVVDMQDRAGWQMGVDVHLVGDGVDQLDRDCGWENILNKDGHDWLLPGQGRSVPGEDRPPQLPDRHPL